MPLILHVRLIEDITHHVTSVGLWIDVSNKTSDYLITSETQLVALVYLQFTII